MGSSCCRRLSPDAGASILTIAPFSLPAHQTGRADLRHPAFRPASPQGTRRTTFNAGVVRQHLGRDRLRHTVQLPPMPPDLYGANRHDASHRPVAHSKAHQKSGSFAPPALPGINARTTLSDFRRDRRPKSALRLRSSSTLDLPRLPETPFQRAVPTTPADRTGAFVDFFPVHAAFPKWPEGRHPHCHFRGLLRLHSYYGPLDRSATQGDLCHEASVQPVTQPNRSSASRPIDNYLGGILLHGCFAPSGRTARRRLRVNPLRGPQCLLEPRLRNEKLAPAKRLCMSDPN